jgi:hypothetical protein
MVLPVGDHMGVMRESLFNFVWNLQDRRPILVSS